MKHFHFRSTCKKKKKVIIICNNRPHSRSWSYVWIHISYFYICSIVPFCCVPVFFPWNFLFLLGFVSLLPQQSESPSWWIKQVYSISFKTHKKNSLYNWSLCTRYMVLQNNVDASVETYMHVLWFVFVWITSMVLPVHLCHQHMLVMSLKLTGE